MVRSIAFLLVILGISAGVYSVFQPEQPPIPLQDVPVLSTEVIIEEAWIEVAINPVFKIEEKQALKLESGDIVKKGDTIETGKMAKATLHFPDGSVLRLDGETLITLSDINFKKSDYSLIVKITLTSGRIWSKVVGLATPESTWEVKSSNTVATVRGTAFGMGYKNGVTFVLGYEHTIGVAPLDPYTNEKITSAEVIIEENRVIEISDNDATFASATTSSVLKDKIFSASGKFVNDSWIKHVKEEDRKFDLEIEKIRKSNDDEGNLRNSIINNVEEEHQSFKKIKPIMESAASESRESTEEIIETERSAIIEGITPINSPATNGKKVNNLKEVEKIKLRDSLEGEIRNGGTNSSNNSSASPSHNTVSVSTEEIIVPTPITEASEQSQTVVVTAPALSNSTLLNNSTGSSSSSNGNTNANSIGNGSHISNGNGNDSNVSHGNQANIGNGNTNSHGASNTDNTSSGSGTINDTTVSGNSNNGGGNSDIHSNNGSSDGNGSNNNSGNSNSGNDDNNSNSNKHNESDDGNSNGMKISLIAVLKST